MPPPADVRPRIAVQAWLPMSQPSGARTRLVGLLTGLGRIREAADLECVLLASTDCPLPADVVAAAAGIGRSSIVSVAIPSWPPWRRSLAEARLLPRILAAEGCTLLDLASLPLPRLQLPVIVTLHDLRDLGRFARPLRLAGSGGVLASAVRRAAGIIVPSPQVASELASRHPEALGRIRVVPPGLQAAATPSAPSGAPVFVHLGRPEPRKELPFLIRAYAAARQRAPDLPGLVLAGPGAPRDWKPLRRLARRLGVAPHLSLPGLLTDEERSSLLAGAVALVFPSSLEGFGLPVLEALQAGCPVLAQRGGVPAWVAGPAGLALEPCHEAWALAMIRLVHDPILRQNLSRAAGARAAEFGVEAAARAWVAAWRAAGPATSPAQSTSEIEQA